VHEDAFEATPDAALATQRIMADDGMSLGIVYTGARAPFRPPMGAGHMRPEDLEAQFAL
jgi:hypothetical protein